MTSENPDVEASSSTTPSIPEGEMEAVHTPDSLDLVSFAAGFALPQDYVPLYKRFDLVAERTAALIELEDAKAESNHKDIQRLRRRAKELTGDIRNSRVVVEIRALSLSRRDEIETEALKAGITDPLQKLIYQTACQVVAPVELQSYEELRALSEVVGGQVARMITAARNLNNMMEPASVPL